MLLAVMSRHYIVREAGWVIAEKLWPSHQVCILCKEDVGKRHESIEAYVEARKILRMSGLLFEGTNTGFSLYDDGEQEPFLVFENHGKRIGVFVKSLVRESLSQIEMLNAIKAVTES